MTDIDSRGSFTHPIGWPFLGAGALLWLPPLFSFLDINWRDWLILYDTTWIVLLLVFGTTILGLCLDPALRPLERLLLWRSGLLQQNPEVEKWDATWRIRWKNSAADAQFRRHEGLASFGRAYLIHALLATFLWPTVTPELDTRLLFVLAGLGATGFFAWVWYINTRLIFHIVARAADWETKL